MNWDLFYCFVQLNKHQINTRRMHRFPSACTCSVFLAPSSLRTIWSVWPHTGASVRCQVCETASSIQETDEDEPIKKPRENPGNSIPKHRIITYRCSHCWSLSVLHFDSYPREEQPGGGEKKKISFLVFCQLEEVALKKVAMTSPTWDQFTPQFIHH